MGIKVCGWQGSYDALVFLFFFLLEHVDTCSLNYINVSISTDLFEASRNSCGETDLSLEIEKVHISEGTEERWEAFYKWLINQHLIFSKNKHWLFI